MSLNNTKINTFFLGSVFLLTLSGFVIFLSASLGLLAQNGVSFGSVAAKQVISLILGIVAFFVFSKIKYTFFRKAAFVIFCIAIGINLLLFIPSMTLNHGGATRWLNLGFVTLQPSEFLKIAFIIYTAAWLNYIKDKIKSMKYGLLSYFVLMTILSVLLLAQSDTDTLVIIGFTGIVMFIIAGMPMRHVVLSGLLMASIVAGVIYMRPYARERLKTFFDHGSDKQGAGYQINQSLIAIGSGQFFGRGFGQSIQKFGYIPEPIGDSIFAVAAEEFGFFGSIVLILLYISLAVSSFRISTKAPDTFSGLLVVGISVLIITESFLNMAAMLGLVPLSGMPLLFVSHGGTALVIILAASGMVANVSRYAR